MNKKQIEILSNIITSIPRGEIIFVSWKRKAKTLKKCPYNIEKKVTGNVRVGIQYENVTENKKQQQNNSSKQQNNAEWGHYPKGLYPYIFEHNKTHKRYVCFYFVPEQNKNKQYFNSQWIKDGEITDFKNIEDFLLKSEKMNKKEKEKKMITFKIPLENLIEIKTIDNKIEWEAENEI